MSRMLMSTLMYLTANAVGLLLAVILLPGFKAGAIAFVVAVLIFSLVQGLSRPIITRLSEKRVPQLMGGVALITILVGLIITSLVVSGMEIGGISNLLAATLLVWLGSLVAEILLPTYVFKGLRDLEVREAEA